jgi:hypothetical protein
LRARQGPQRICTCCLGSADRPHATPLMAIYRDTEWIQLCLAAHKNGPASQRPTCLYLGSSRRGRRKKRPRSTAGKLIASRPSAGLSPGPVRSRKCIIAGRDARRVCGPDQFPSRKCGRLHSSSRSLVRRDALPRCNYATRAAIRQLSTLLNLYQSAGTSPGSLGE